MSVSALFVEGNLDSEILTAVLRGRPLVRRGGSKNSLKPQARYERDNNHVMAGYLRDRDFDYEPSNDLESPVVDANAADKSVLGWRWVRHEIENYLIDPAIVEASTGIPALRWSGHLTECAIRIRWYQIARWVVGEVRRSIPPNHKLETRPPKLGELRLPDCIDQRTTRDWCEESIRAFAARVASNMSEEHVGSRIEFRSSLLTEHFLSESANALVWCSGKDLFAALPRETLVEVGCKNAGALRAHLRD